MSTADNNDSDKKDHLNDNDSELEQREQQELAKESDQTTDEVAKENIDVELQRNVIGDLLREKRESLELSIQEVAQTLNLSLSYVEALENEMFDVLPNTLFCQGYLRNYANMLGLDADEMVTMLNTKLGLYSVQSNSRVDVKPIKLAHVESNSSWKKIALLSLLPIICILAVIAWFSQSQSDGGNLSTEDALFDMVASQEDIELDIDIAGKQNAASQENTLANDEEGNIIADLNSDELTVEQTKTDVVSKQVNSNTNLVDQNNSAQTLTAVVDVLEQAKKQTEETSSTSVSRSTAGEDHILIDYVEEAWTEIYDANDKRLVYEIKKAGERLDIRGKAPFFVKLGRPTAAIVQLNGNIVSIKTDKVNSPISFVLD